MTRNRIARFFLLALLTGLPVAAQAAEGGLQLVPDLTQLIILIVFFVLLLFPTNKIVFEPLMEALEEREKRIEGAQKRAKELGGEADRVLGTYEEAIGEARKAADSVRSDAMDEARKEQARVTNEARASAEEEVKRARDGVAASLEQARTELRTQAEDLARQAAAQVLGRSVS